MNDVDQEDAVLCRLCRRPFRAITWTHLVRKHHAPPDETPIRQYKQRFGLEFATCDETRALGADIRRAYWDQHGRRWTREVVHRELRDLARQGFRLSWRATTARNDALTHAAVRLFGSWVQALAAIGIRHEDVRRVQPRTRERVLREIRARQASGARLNMAAASREASTLVNNARHAFGSWKKAVEAAGIQYDDVRLLKPWTRSRLLRAIKDLRRRNEPLHRSHVRRNHAGLLHAARKLFGSWSAAVAAAGVNYDKVSKRLPWTVDRMRTVIRERSERGQPLNLTDVVAALPGLVRAARRVFGPWREALQACGVDPQAVRRVKVWTRERIMARIRERARTGLSVNAEAARSDGSLPWAAKRIFGSWDAALRACGIQPDAVRRTRIWTPERVLDAIRELHKAGKPLHYKAMERSDLGLLGAAKKRFGNWNGALSAAGVGSPE